MKPIEAGCLAIVTKGMMTGTVVTCLKFVGRPGMVDNCIFVSSDLWEVDRMMPFKYGDHPYSRESWLMRIDGGNFKQLKETDELTISAYDWTKD